MRKEKKHVGCSGFYNYHWKSVFYPQDMPSSKWLEFYCEHFNTLELNTTFYKFPTLKSLQTWYNKSPEGFLFSVKASKPITHLKKFVDCQEMIDQFYAVCQEGLKEKLGCVLFQLPPSFQFSEERLELIINSLNPNFKNVIEFRHESWWSQNVYDALEKNNIIFCSVSHPKLPETIIATTSTGYIRLHGREKMFYSDYGSDELETLQQAILKTKKWKEVFIFFNNTAGTAGIMNAQSLQEIMNTSPS